MMKTSHGAIIPSGSALRTKMRLAKILNQLSRTTGATLARRPIAAVSGLGVLPCIWIAGSDRIIDYAFRAVNAQHKWILGVFLWSVICLVR